MKLLREFILILVQNWISVFSCVAVIAFILLSFRAQAGAQIRIFSLSALVFLFVGLTQAWAIEYRRAEKARMENGKEPRPRVTVGEYSATREDRERDEEYLVEALQITNKGELPAIGITVRPIQAFGLTARLFASIPNLDPGETKEIRILNLHRTLERAAEKAIKYKGHALSVRLPMIVEYQDLKNERWITDHVVLFGVDGINIDVVQVNEAPEWTAFSNPRRR